MLLRLISAIALLFFALQLISGSQIDEALYRGLIVFLLLFAGIYLSIYFINIIQSSSGKKTATPSLTPGNTNNKNTGQETKPSKDE